MIDVAAFLAMLAGRHNDPTDPWGTLMASLVRTDVVRFGAAMDAAGHPLEHDQALATFLRLRDQATAVPSPTEGDEKVTLIAAGVAALPLPARRTGALQVDVALEARLPVSLLGLADELATELGGLAIAEGDLAFERTGVVGWFSHDARSILVDRAWCADDERLALVTAHELAHALDAAVVAIPVDDMGSEAFAEHLAPLLLTFEVDSVKSARPWVDAALRACAARRQPPMPIGDVARAVAWAIPQTESEAA